VKLVSTHVLLLVAALLAIALPAQDHLGGRRRILEVARNFELKPTEAAPEWAQRTDPPLARLVWISDLHLNQGYLPLAHESLNYINTLAPHAVLATGDNCAYAPADFRPELTGRYERCAAYFQHLLASELQAPAVVLPGDNWPWDYHKVFGPRQFTFDLAGVHIICLGVDRAARGVEGCSVFDESTWAWLEKELADNPGKPTLVAMHENPAPPTFLDAGRLANLLGRHPQVLGTLTGHLHLDVEFQVGHIRHVVCPALGPSLTHGLKTIHVYPDAIILQTHEQGEGGEAFHPVHIWQRIEIPAALRTGLSPAPDGYRPTRLSEVPARPLIEDPALRNRAPELLPPSMAFLFKFSMSNLHPSVVRPASAELP
jgi:hypothetical protein